MWPTIEALLVEIHAATPGAVRRDDVEQRIRLVPVDTDSPLPLDVTARDDELAITIEGWTETFTANPDDPDDDAEERALDLVAAALFGRLHVHTTSTGDRVTLREYVFATSRGPIVHRTERAFRWPWESVTTITLGNAVPVPPAITLGETGQVPRTPWSGLLSATRTATPGELAIDGELDLHPFKPKEVKPLVLEYIEVCKQRGIVELRIVHGKGIGALRRTVHALLAKHPDVASYRLGGMGEGSWGATLVTLRRSSDR